jgi:hypothetical protein
MNNAIHIPSKEEEAADLQEYFKRAKTVSRERLAAAIAAEPALKRLCKVLCERSGQPYKLRSILFSIWNGKPASMIEIVSLDWEIRKDLSAVLLAFGFEGNGVEFFYSALQRAITAAGQWNWFVEEADDVRLLTDYVEAAKARTS